MKVIKLFLIMLMFVLLVACSTNIKDATYSAETEGMVNQTDKLTKDEKELFESAVTFAKNSNIDLEGQIVSSIIAEEKTRLEEERKKEEERKRELQRKKEEEEQKLNNSLQVTLDQKSIIPEGTYEYQFNDIVAFHFLFTNTTDKDIRGFKGTAIFNDLFGDNIKKLNLSYDELITANGQVFWKGSLDVNPFMDEDIKLRNMNFTSINFEFEMDTIIFSDGTTISKY